MRKNKRKGFTLAELLIVVAIIAVLVAIAIPIFTSQLEKSREATDAANIRAAYAQASVEVLETEKAVTYKVNMVQTDAGFKSEGVKDAKIGGKTLSSITDAKNDKPVYVTVNTEGTAPTIDTTLVTDAKNFN